MLIVHKTIVGEGKHSVYPKCSDALSPYCTCPTIKYILIYLKPNISNNVDPDQMLHSATSDLDLHCLPSRKHAYIILTPLKAHFYIVKLGFAGVYIIFLILLKNIDCGYPLELPH